MKNVFINKRKNNSVLILDKTFYPQEAILQATKVFSDVFDAKIMNKKFYVGLNLKLRNGLDANINQATYEFLNHLFVAAKTGGFELDS